jgi:WD40 repeat protein
VCWTFKELTGHVGGIEAVALTRDGQLALSGSRDETVRLWNSSTGECVRVLEGSSGKVACLSLSVDGKYVLSASGGAGSDRTIRLWETRTGKCLRVFEDCGRGATSISFFPDGKSFAWCGRDTGLHRWDLDGGVINNFGKATSRPVSLHVSPDGLTLISSGASGSDSPGIHLWEVITGTLYWIAQGHEGGIPSVRFSRDGRLLASGGVDHTVRVWDAGTGTPLSCFRGHTAPVHSVDISPDHKFILSGSADETFRIWSVSTSACEAEVRAHSGQVNAVAFTPDGRRVVSGGEDGVVRIWELDWEYEFPANQDRGKQDAR